MKYIFGSTTDIEVNVAEGKNVQTGNPFKVAEIDGSARYVEVGNDYVVRSGEALDQTYYAVYCRHKLELSVEFNTDIDSALSELEDKVIESGQSWRSPQTLGI